MQIPRVMRATTMCCLLAGGIGLVGCETNPYTGRSQLLMTSVSQEMQMGAQAYNQVKSDPNMRPSQDPREIEPVKTGGGSDRRGRETVEVRRNGPTISVGSHSHQG